MKKKRLPQTNRKICKFLFSEGDTPLRGVSPVCLPGSTGVIILVVVVYYRASDLVTKSQQLQRYRSCSSSRFGELFVGDSKFDHKDDLQEEEEEEAREPLCSWPQVKLFVWVTVENLLQGDIIQIYCILMGLIESTIN